MSVYLKHVFICCPQHYRSFTEFGNLVKGFFLVILKHHPFFFFLEGTYCWTGALHFSKEQEQCKFPSYSVTSLYHISGPALKYIHALASQLKQGGQHEIY